MERRSSLCLRTRRPTVAESVAIPQLPWVNESQLRSRVRRALPSQPHSVCVFVCVQSLDPTHAPLAMRTGVSLAALRRFCSSPQYIGISPLRPPLRALRPFAAACRPLSALGLVRDDPDDLRGRVLKLEKRFEDEFAKQAAINERMQRDNATLQSLTQLLARPLSHSITNAELAAVLSSPLADTFTPRERAIMTKLMRCPETE